MNEKLAAVLAAVILIFSLAACGPRPRPGRPRPLGRPTWSKARATQAIEKLADQYRKDPAGFYEKRTYVWVGTWVWPETMGIKARHLKLLKKIFYGGDAATREIILNVVFMNIPPGKLTQKDKKFMKDLVLLDTELKESRADVPPPSDQEKIIEENAQP